jgi:hypothetical protein
MREEMQADYFERIKNEEVQEISKNDKFGDDKNIFDKNDSKILVNNKFIIEN